MEIFMELYKMHESAQKVYDLSVSDNTYKQALEYKIIDEEKYEDIMQKQEELASDARTLMNNIIVSINDMSNEDIIEEMSKAYNTDSFDVITNSKMKELINQACTDEEEFHQQKGEAEDNPYSEIRYKLQAERMSRA